MRVPVPALAWQVLHVKAVANPKCFACAPAMLGKAVPPGPCGKPGVPQWQDRQVPGPVATKVGSASVWQMPHRGAEGMGEAPM